MAYKFQFGAATLSGSTTFEEALVAESTISSSAAVSALSLNLGGVPVSATAAELNLLDSITRGSILVGGAGGSAELDAKTSGQILVGDGTDIASVAVSGDATLASNGALTVADEAITVAKLAHAAANTVLVRDASDTGDPSFKAVTDTQILIGNGSGFTAAALSGDVTMANDGEVTIAANAVEDSMVNDNVATGLAGVGLGASSGVLAVQVSGAIVIDNDKVGLSGSIAGQGLTFLGGINSISDLSVDIATNGGLSKTAGVSSDQMAIDINDLSAAAVDVAADSIAIVDANDSNRTRKESIADLVSAMAGAGLTAASGQLSTDGAAVGAIADGDTLVTGVNYLADLSSDATLALPGSPSVGDRVTVKARNLTSGANVIINRTTGTHTIDGESSIRIESPFGAVTMVYVVANDWRIL